MNSTGKPTGKLRPGQKLENNLLLALPVVNQPNIHHFVPLRDGRSPRVIPLPIHNRKPPDLIAGPAPLLIVDPALNMSLRRRPAVFLVPLQPPILQIGFLNSIQRNPPTPPLQVPKYMIAVRALCPVEFAQLRRAFDTPCRRLLDVDVGVPVFGRVLFHVQRYGREADSFACPPADTLERKDSVGVVGEGFIL